MPKHQSGGQQSTARSTKTPTSSSNSSSSTGRNGEPDFFSRPDMPAHQDDSSSPESSDDDSIGRSGPSNQASNRSNVNDSIGRPGPSSQARANPTGIKAGTNAGPLSRKRQPSHSAPRQSEAPTPKTPARKTPRKQAKPKRRRDLVMRQIRLLQNSVDFLIPRAPFHRLVRETMQREVTFAPHEDFRITADALKALQTSAEAFLVGTMEDASFCAYHRQRVTLHPKDIILVRMLRRDPELNRQN